MNFHCGTVVSRCRPTNNEMYFSLCLSSVHSQSPNAPMPWISLISFAYIKVDFVAQGFRGFHGFRFLGRPRSISVYNVAFLPRDAVHGTDYAVYLFVCPSVVRRDQSCCWGPIESPIRAFYRAKINDSVWPWRAIMHSVSKHSFRSHHKNLNKDRHTFSDKDVA